MTERLARVKRNGTVGSRARPRRRRSASLTGESCSPLADGEGNAKHSEHPAYRPDAVERRRARDWLSFLEPFQSLGYLIQLAAKRARPSALAGAALAPVQSCDR